MGRVKGKGKKQPIVAARDEIGSEEENKILASKRRGRPQKPLKDEVVECEEVDKIKDDINDDENPKSSITSKSSKDENAAKDGMKRRKRSSRVTENSDPVTKENDSEAKSSTEDSVKSVGFRQNGSRRKSKPRRAAEAGVECN